MITTATHNLLQPAIAYRTSRGSTAARSTRPDVLAGSAAPRRRRWSRPWSPARHVAGHAADPVVRDTAMSATRMYLNLR